MNAGNGEQGRGRSRPSAAKPNLAQGKKASFAKGSVGPAAVRVHIPWRRRDKHPELTDVAVTDSEGRQIRNVLRRDINREFGELIFEPTSGPGTYFFYILPHVTHGTYYPRVEYISPVDTADAVWKVAAQAANWQDLPEAKPVRFESVSALDAFTPMEIIATKAEIEALLSKNPNSDFLVFPEERHLSIRMWDDLPHRWVARGANTPFAGQAKRGEYFTFQLGVWACRENLESVKVRFSALKRPAGRTLQSVIPAAAITCLNTNGVGCRGEFFEVDLKVPRGRVQPLWCGIEIPTDAQPGTYIGAAVVSAKGAKEVRIPITLAVGKEIAKHHGDDVPEDMTRLRWLNSRRGAEPAVVKPFTAVSAAGARLSILGRTLNIGGIGLPLEIGSRFSSRMDHIDTQNTELLAEPFQLSVQRKDGKQVKVPYGHVGLKQIGTEAIEWEGAHNPEGAPAKSSGGCRIRVSGRLEFDGQAELKIQITAEQNLDLNDIRLEIPLNRKVAQYFMGLGRDGGRAPESLDWKWDVKNSQEGAWVGGVSCGLMFALRDEHYVRPLNTNFYHEKPLVMPTSWCNGGRGGIRIQTEGDCRRIACYSGPRTMKKGETLHFNVHMLLTPFKPIDPKRQFSERYFHAYKPVDEIERDGANVINVHHATEINPWINYPFLEPAKMKAYVDDAHKRGMKVKIYDTIRELTNRTPELFALKSLGHEVFSSGKGGGGSWLCEHLDGDYISAWHATEVGDASIVNSGISRWHNYYIEGLDWLAQNVGIDGLYLDDVAFDRTTMLRVRRVLERRIAERTANPPSHIANRQPTNANRPSEAIFDLRPSTFPGPIIDLHSANQHNERDGWNNSALLYMDLMPFLDRLWFGEYFDYGKGPDFWLVEMSGIPFGLMGEMLQDGGNPWRGMLFGMTARRPWSGDPRPLWKLWDAFGINDAEMIGWWADDCPAATNSRDVLATVYLRGSTAIQSKGSNPRPKGVGEALIAIASWSKTPKDVSLKFDWKKLKMDPADAELVAEPIEGFQPGRAFKIGEPIPVEPRKGWLLWLRSRQPHS